jgi:hypothetical protein
VREGACVLKVCILRKGWCRFTRRFALGGGCAHAQRCS